MQLTVEELIQILSEYPSDMRVVVNGYEDGYDDLSPKQICVVNIALNTGVDDWIGKHTDPDFLLEVNVDDLEIVETLVLQRTSG